MALWGDALRPLEPGRVALVSQSGNVAVNTLATKRGLRLHTVVSCGNSAAVDPADWIAQLARDEGVGSIAVYLEADGDGVRLCEAFAECADRGVGVTVLKVGSSPAGALAAAAHTGAVAGDQRVFRALVEEAGAAWAEDVHELLELAKAQAVPGARPRPAPGTGLGILTCSGGDSALAADYCARTGLALPALAPETAARLRELLPDAATVGNPLDYTALIWGEVETLRDIVLTVAGDPSIDQVMVLYDQPVGIEGASAESLGSGARGHPPRRGREPGARDGRLDASRAARRRRRRPLRRRRHTRRSRDSAPGSWGPRRSATRPPTPHGCARSRPPPRAAATAPWRWPSTRPRTCCAPRACRWSRAAWPPARTRLPRRSRTSARRSS